MFWGLYIYIQSNIALVCQKKENGWWGRNYEGQISRTKSGRTCQHWAVKYPHNHGFNYLPENYCRNPDGEPEGLLFSGISFRGAGDLVVFHVFS